MSAVLMATAVSILSVPKIGKALTISDDFSTGLVSYWELEEISGVRYDSHGSNDLTDNNTVLYTVGKLGNAGDFERTNTEYLTINDNASLSITGDMSIAFWVKFEDALSSGQDCTLFDKFNVTGNNRGYSLAYENAGGTYRFIVRVSGAGTSASYGYVNYTLTAGSWFYVVNLYDASAGTWQIYVNGTSAGTVSSLPTSIYDNSAVFNIGYNSDIAGGSYDGLIDEFGIWNNVLLTGGDITSLYNGGVGISYSTPVSTSSTSTATTTTTSADVSELKWVLELYLAIFMFLVFTWLGYRFTKIFI